jgi:ribose 5-phosphate isomerase B
MMRTAIGSDENSELTDALVAELEERGHEIVAFGPVANEEESDWPLVCGQVAETVAAGAADEGIVCCWMRRRLAGRVCGTTPTCWP